MAWDSMTREDIRLEVREVLGEDEAETDPFWSNAYINVWINRMARLVVEVTSCLEQHENFNTVADQEVYDLPGRIFKPTLIKMNGNTELDPIEVQQLGKINVSVEGTPRRYLVFGRKLHLYPVPNSVEQIDVWGHAYPPFLENDGDTLTGVTGEICDVIIKLVLAKCHEKDQEYGVANNYYSQVPFDIADYVFKRVNSQDQKPHNVRDVMGWTEGS